MTDCHNSANCTCERCQQDWCGDVGNIVYHASSRDSVGQSADLRTRIAAALKAEDEKPHICPFDGEPTMASYDRLADAVIRELGLHQEFSVGDDEGGRTLWFADEEPVIPREGETVEVRWISQWEPDE